MGTAKSNEITVLDTSGSIEESGLGSSKVKEVKGEIAVGTGDIDADDILVMVQIPSKAKISEILLYNDDLDAGGPATITVDCGLYNGPEPIPASRNGGAAKDAGAVLDFDCFATDSTALQAAANKTDLRFEAANITTIDDEAWELAGLSEDPGVPLRVALTIGTAADTAQAGDVVLIVRYTDD